MGCIAIDAEANRFAGCFLGCSLRQFESDSQPVFRFELIRPQICFQDLFERGSLLLIQPLCVEDRGDAGLCPDAHNTLLIADAGIVGGAVFPYPGNVFCSDRDARGIEEARILKRETVRVEIGKCRHGGCARVEAGGCIPDGFLDVARALPRRAVDALVSLVKIGSFDGNLRFDISTVNEVARLGNGYCLTGFGEDGERIEGGIVQFTLRNDGERRVDVEKRAYLDDIAVAFPRHCRNHHHGSFGFGGNFCHARPVTQCNCFADTGLRRVLFVGLGRLCQLLAAFKCTIERSTHQEGGGQPCKDCAAKPSNAYPAPVRGSPSRTVERRQLPQKQTFCGCAVHSRFQIPRNFDRKKKFFGKKSVRFRR